MKLLISFLIFLNLSANAEVSSIEIFQKRSVQRLKVLNAHLRSLLEARSHGITWCLETQNSTETNPLLVPLRAETDFEDSHQETQAIEYINLYQMTSRFENLCGHFIAIYEDTLAEKERTSFESLEYFAETIAQWGKILPKDKVDRLKKEIDPHCEVVSIPNILGTLDGNPCYATDFFIGEQLFTNRVVQTKSTLQSFLSRLSELVKMPEKPTKIDLWNVFLYGHFDSRENRLFFLELLSFLAVSTNSNAGTSDGFFRVLITDQLKKGISPTEIIETYQSVKKMRDKWSDLLYIISKNGIELTLDNYALNGGNVRHDFMGAFQGCYYHDDGDLLSQTLPSWMGKGYEALDFVSHLQGNGLKLSYQNYKQDSQKHSMAARWGKLFCDYDTETLDKKK